MKSHVIVDGKFLTFEQVRSAWEELNTPEVANLTRVQRRSGQPMEGVVIWGQVQRTYACACSSSQLPFTVVLRSGIGYSYPDIPTLLKEWEPLDDTPRTTLRANLD